MFYKRNNTGKNMEVNRFKIRYVNFYVFLPLSSLFSKQNILMFYNALSLWHALSFVSYKWPILWCSLVEGQIDGKNVFLTLLFVLTYYEY